MRKRQLQAPVFRSTNINLGAQWLSGRVLETEGPWVQASLASLRCGP